MAVLEQGGRDHATLPHDHERRGKIASAIISQKAIRIISQSWISEELLQGLELSFLVLRQLKQLSESNVEPPVALPLEPPPRCTLFRLTEYDLVL